ncbi:MAG: UvrD-helicase domain-containing protein, partial [Firmicutes bacterium]|nr:UvrD-helicase domain-containing protein [Bacillota bacterium]
KTVLIKKGIEIIKEQIAERRGAEITRWCREVLEHVDRAYRRKKDSAGILDFNDLEHLAYVLLQDPQVGADYNFRHLLVDEFQDTNPLQKKIVDSLAGEKTRLFIVGDPKQSIYRFRGADVNVFLDTKEEIKARGKKVFLEENFRSRPEVVSFTNSFFQRLMGSGPISYQASNFRRPALGKPSVNILRTPALGLTLKEARSLEARQVALKIKSLVDQGDYNYEDISILFRVMTNVRFYEQALQELNIPYVNLSGRGFYSRREIQDVLHYFSWLEDPENEIARLAVLRSPFYLVSDQGLFWVRQNRPEKMGLADREALERSNNDYSVLKDLMVQKPAPEVISTMLELTGYVQKTWELPFGPQKTANVKKLVEQSWDLYTRDLVSVPEQLRYLRLAAESSEREGEAALDVEHADVVVLRTIHAAKGLEFPVVFLADTNGRLTRSGGERVLFHPDFGLTSKGQKDYELLKERNKEEELEEAKRLLYVAVTRAREELFWCGLEGPLQKNSWWNWLRTVLPELPADLYREIEGREEWPEAETAPALEEEASEPTSLKPLPPQYRQVSFSVTALLNYARCPRYYYFRYILGVPENFGEQPQSSPSGLETGLSALKRGNIVHRVCEQITAREDLGALIDYAAAMEGVRLNAGEKKQLKTMITPYLQSRFFRRVIGAEPGWQIYKEKEFTEILANFVINGMIDQVFVGAAGVEVLDFKSNWIQESQVAQEGRGYEVQLRLYAWAAARAFDLPVTKSQAYFLIPNKIYSLPAEQLAAAETEQWIIQTCTAIIAGADRGLEAFPPGPDCSRCGYQSFCGNSRGFGENTGETGQEVLS